MLCFLCWHRLQEFGLTYLLNINEVRSCRVQLSARFNGTNTVCQLQADRLPTQKINDIMENGIAQMYRLDYLADFHPNFSRIILGLSHQPIF